MDGKHAYQCKVIRLRKLLPHNLRPEYSIEIGIGMMTYTEAIKPHTTPFTYSKHHRLQNKHAFLKLKKPKQHSNHLMVLNHR